VRFGLFVSTKNPEPCVTVVIPCYNNGEEIIRSISSIQKQSYSNTQIILVNDGSTDAKTLSLLSSLQDKVEIVEHATNRGLPAARNSGFAAASGDFVLFLDADDWYDSRSIGAMVSVATEASGDFFIFSNMMLEGSRTGINPRPYRPYSQLMRNGLPYSIMVPRLSLDPSRLYDINLTQGLEDWDLNLRLISENFKPLQIELPLFHYFVSEKGMFQRQTLKQFFQTWRYIREKHRHTYERKNLSKVFSQEREKYSFWSMLPAVVMFHMSKFPFDAVLNRLLIVYLRLTRGR